MDALCSFLLPACRLEKVKILKAIIAARRSGDEASMLKETQLIIVGYFAIVACPLELV